MKEINKLNQEDGISLMAYAVLLRNQSVDMTKCEAALESLKDTYPDLYEYVINNVEFNINGNGLDVYSSVIEDEALVKILQAGRNIKKNDRNS